MGLQSGVFIWRYSKSTSSGVETRLEELLNGRVSRRDSDEGARLRGLLNDRVSSRGGNGDARLQELSNGRLSCRSGDGCGDGDGKGEDDISLDC